MSTRCNIVIKDSDYNTCFLYHHHDGYPKGVGKDLYDRFAHIFEKKYNRLLIHDVVNKLIKDPEDEYEYTTGIHGDIDYLYEIDVDDKTIRCFEVSYKTEGRTEIDLEAVLNKGNADE